LSLTTAEQAVEEEDTEVQLPTKDAKEVEVGAWERHTRGIGLRLLLKMGYKKVRVSCGHSLRDRVRHREERKKRERERNRGQELT
jgi:hypothetical protein